MTDSPGARRLASELKRRARDEGFDAVGVAGSVARERYRSALHAWLGQGRHASMEWMARDPGKRADPGQILPGCRSVIVLGMNYWPGRERYHPDGAAARVAAYARGRDYHKVLGAGARRLAGWLKENTGQPARPFVDTGPVLERAWAEMAGIGWIGKNANLISRDVGSWMLLAVILSAAEVDPDAGPHADFCGSCAACVEACPTRAIVEPGVVDSRLCISYWTIERRGAISDRVRRGIGDWLFGCDVCQEVCPWNRKFARTAPADRFGFREDLDRIDPEQLLGMDEAGFRQRYSGTSLMRAKWEGMRRNACVVLGNRRSAAALPSLGVALGDGDPVIRAHAAWAVGLIGGVEAQRMLAVAATAESDEEVLVEIRKGLPV